MLRGLVAGAIAVSGCYAPTPATGVPCPDGVCPSGQTCDPGSQTCGFATIDAAPTDGFVDASSCSTGCGGTAPICEAGTCRACLADSECASDACLEYTGRCADETEVIYAAPGGGGGECTRMQPCRLGTAFNRLQPDRTVIRLAPGDYAEELKTSANGVTTIISGPTRDPSAVVVSSKTGATAVLEGPTVLEGVTLVAKSGDGVTAMADATLHRVHITQAMESGIEAFAPVHLFDSRIDEAATHGIYSATTGIEVEVVRSRIVDCTSGGITLASPARLTVASSVIARNGTPTSPNGGINVAAPLMGSAIRYSTIANNRIDPASGAPGIRCGGALSVSDSIIATNGMGVAQVDAACVTTSSLYTAPMASGTGNMLGAPMFVDEDYHISSQSAARNVGTQGAVIPADIDGESRPRGMAPDVGADEIP